MAPAVTRFRDWFRAAVLEPLIGRADEVPAALVTQWPELATVRWRRGGLPPRVGGWCLGQASVQGITLWRTVFLAPDAPWEPAFLLHEHRHAEQFAASAAFPFLYLWESLRRGYACNRFETDADACAASRLHRPRPTNLSPGA